MKVKLTVQDDVYSGTVLEQAVVIEYVIINDPSPDAAAESIDAAESA